MPVRRAALALLLGLAVAATALVVGAPHAGADGNGGRPGGAVVTEVGGVLDAARTAAKRSPALTLLLVAVLAVALPAAPRPCRPVPTGHAGSRPRPVLLRAAAGRAPPLPSPLTAR